MLYAQLIALSVNDLTLFTDFVEGFIAELSEMYAESYEREYTQMRSRVDGLEDNTISTDNKPASAVIMLSSGPRRRWYDNSK